VALIARIEQAASARGDRVTSVVTSCLTELWRDIDRLKRDNVLYDSPGRIVDSIYMLDAADVGSAPCRAISGHWAR